jgi:uncharacterized protein (TIGR04255 family)
MDGRDEMGERLASPPLIEAICEFRFAPGERWDATLPGRLHERISNEFPERSQVRQMGVQFQLHGDRDPMAEIIQPPDRVQLKRRDGSAMVQVGPDLLAVNQLRPYASWEMFRALIVTILDQFTMLVSASPALTRIGLRYINRLMLPEDDCELGDFTTLSPPLKGVLERPLLGFYQRYELAYDTPRGILIHQTGIQTFEDHKFLMVDLDFGSLEPPAISDPEAIEHWLNQAHDRVYEGFVQSLDPELYRCLKEGVV